MRASNGSVACSLRKYCRRGVFRHDSAGPGQVPARVPALLPRERVPEPGGAYSAQSQLVARGPAPARQPALVPQPPRRRFLLSSLSLGLRYLSFAHS